MYKGYLIDLDGTAYLGTDVILSMVEFTNILHRKQIPFKFVTNNSKNTENDVVDKLTAMGYNISPENIVTTARATSNYLWKVNPNRNIYVIGDGGLITALNDNNLTIVNDDDYLTADTVVIGLNQNVNYEQFARACLAVRNGAEFISTNPDIALPSERGMLPGNGALTALIATSTNQQPLFIGKPYKYIMEEALSQLQLEANQVAMIGDNYNTDIMAGIQMNMDTIFVETGLTTIAELDEYPIKPTHICKTITEFIDKL